MSYKRGDIVILPFPDSNLLTVKIRPVIIVQADNLQTGLPQLIVAMISSNLSRAGCPSRVAVSIATPEGQQSGLVQDSVIMADNLATVLEKDIRKRLGNWPSMSAVDNALRNALGL